MTIKTINVDSVGEAYLRILAERGVDYMFANAGTDFAPLIEAMAKAERTGDRIPQAIAVPHENAAVSMAHGYTQVTGKPQVVMNHVNVGTANAINGALNASRARIPVILSAGRTPATERGDVLGARNANIHWGQEMFDQGGMLREIVKWDYELRSGVQPADMIDRAIEMATSAPPGPVYLSLPREVLGERISEAKFEDPARRALPTALRPSPEDIDIAAGMLAKAEFPLIVTANSGRNPAAVPALADLAERFGIGVVEFRPSYVCLPTEHPMHVGFNPMALIDKADVIMVMDLDVAWMPALAKPREDARIINLDLDPGYGITPMRSFERDVALVGDSALALPMLGDAIEAAGPDKTRIGKRYKMFKSMHDEQREEWAAMAEKVRNDGPIHPAWLSKCIDEISDSNTVRVHEYPFVFPQMKFENPGELYGFSSAGGLGWGFGGALGVKLAQRDKLVICGLGDGSYMFSNPTPCHYVSAAEDLPILVVLFNNHRWHAVWRSTESMYKDGVAVNANRMPLVPLEPSPDFEMVAKASGAHAEKVEDPAEVMGALERAVKAVTVEKRQALLNVHTAAFAP